MPKQTILIVDDDEQERDILYQTVQTAGYEVLFANDGESAIERAQSLQPDIILMDIIMPGLNGFNTTRKISKHPDTKHIPIIFISNKAMESDRTWGMMSGAKAYITKPFDSQEVLDAIQHWLLTASGTKS